VVKDEEMSAPRPIDSTPWHARPAADATRHFGVEPLVGQTAAEAGRRLEQYGPNRLIEAPKLPWWRAFLRQFQDLLIVILLVAAVVSLLVSREWETPAAIAFVVLLNAVIGFAQESRAQAALDALRRMSVTTATVRRDGRLVRLDADELVPGDVVVVEPGDRVPADGRLLTATSLEIQESMLTGEAQAAVKSASAEVDDGAALGDRVNTVYLNTAVTRGRGEVLVTSTGMRTEMGRIAHLLHGAQAGQSPLQRQINTLSRTLAIIAAVVIAVVFLLGLLRGQQFGVLFVSAVSLAVAAIPEGLPAVVAFTLAMGTGRLARRGAVVKRLASVETLGSTSQICTDKTGTLTLNQMTAREMLLAGRRFTASGEGYATDGRIRTTDGSPLPGTLNHALIAMALCSEAVLRDGDVVGDPTEGALVVLAEKGGIDVTALRAERPRLLEIPFDSDYKFMATFHRWTDDQDGEMVRCFVKGAPDVLSARADRYLGESAVAAFDAGAQARYEQANAQLAEQGMRVMAIGVEDFPAAGFDPAQDPKDMLDRLVLVALVGIVDPPRPEARQAIAECHDAGIRVRMITGDHAVTAAAIAAELGIPGKAVTGADLDAIDDDAVLARRLDDIGVWHGSHRVTRSGSCGCCRTAATWSR
jgi:Ca2+-transporting ATPase